MDGKRIAGSASAVHDRRRLLILATAFPPWGGGGVIRIAKLVKYLPELGWSITVVCSDEARPLLVDQSMLDEVPSSVRVIRVRGPFHGIGGSATGAVSGAWHAGRARRVAGMAIAVGRSVILPDRWIGWAASAARMSIEQLGPADAVLSTGPPHSTHLAGARLARRLGAAFVVDLRDDWAGNPFGRNVAPWQPKINAYLEGRTLQRADRVVVVSDRMRQSLGHRHPALGRRLACIPNGFDPADISGIPAREVPSPHRPVKFLYAGRLLNQQSVGGFWSVFGGLAGLEESLSLELLGLIEPDQVRQATDAIPAERLSIRGAVPHAEALVAMGRADVLVVVTEGGGAGAGTMTGKIYEYLALRRPILLIGPEGDAADLIRSSGAGVVASPHDPEALGVAIRAASDMARSKGFIGATHHVLRVFDRRLLASAWSELLSSSIDVASGRGNAN